MLREETEYGYWSVCNSLAIPWFKSLFIFVWTHYKKKKDANASCSNLLHLCCIQEAIHFPLSAIKKIRLHPKWNLTFCEERTQSMKKEKRIQLPKCLCWLRSLTESYSLVGRKILSANWKTHLNTLVECCLVILTHRRSKLEKLLYIYFDPLPECFNFIFYL